VVFVNRYFHPDESATAQLLTDLACGLAADGLEVHVVCCRQLYVKPRETQSVRETVRGVRVCRVWTTRFGRRRLAGRALDYLSFHASSAAALFGLLRRGDIVIAMTDPPLISIVAAAVAALKGALLVNWLQDVFPEVATRLGAGSWPGALEGLLRCLRDASLRRAAVNVVLATRMGEYLATRSPPARIRVIGNWADPESIRPKPAAHSSLRCSLGLDERFVVGYSGNLGRAHDLATLMGAAEILRAETSVIFLMIGGGVRMEAFEKEAARRRLEQVHFLPYQPRGALEDSLAAADVHVVSLLPALEGLIVPSKFYGILAAGRPSVFIGDPDGELARLIGEHRCGRVAASGDPAQLSEALLALKSDVRERTAMGERARQLLCSRHATRAALRLWAELIEDIQARYAAPRPFRR